MREINSYGANMADDTRQVRVKERLKIKIGEAKNLPARGAGGGGGGAGALRDTYCVLSLDQEEIFRTSTIERTLNPFFGEEFQFEVPRAFRYLSLYAFDRDRGAPKNDRVLGKVAIKREDLHRYNNRDHWFALRPVDADSEVQGKAHIEVSCAPPPPPPSTTPATAAPALARSESLRDRHQWTVASRTKPPLHAMEAATSPGSADYWSDPERHCAGGGGGDEAPDALWVRLLECSELTTKGGQCDPYALVAVLYADGRRVERRTRARKKTINPQFDESFCFDLRLSHDHNDKESAWCEGGGEVSGCGAAAVEVHVSVWHDAAPPAFLGEVRLPLRGVSGAAAPARAWYLLTSRGGAGAGAGGGGAEAARGATPPGTRLSAGGGACALGSLRLLMQYTVDHVFPLHHYQRLSALFLKTIHVKPVTASAVYILGELVSSKTDAAQPLVRLFTHHDLIVPVVRQLADAEISALTDATTIFRGNTLVSKMMDEAMRLVGGGYLRAVLRPTLAAVLAERRPCEIDPARVKPAHLATPNLANLVDYVERVFAAITSSYAACPVLMCQLFDALRQCAARHFPHNREVRYSVVSGFIFLRFFAPAILGPRLFDLTTEQIDPQTNRTLTLISKTIQSLGNLVSSRSAQQVCKEEYMAALYRSFCTPRHVQAIKQFLEIISTGADAQNNNIQDAPVLLKEGTMIKRAEGSRGGAGGGASPRRRWTRAAYAHSKRRHFRLTSGELSWSQCGAKGPLRRLALSGVRGVAALDLPPAGAPLGATNVFQIVHRERVLYVQANNCVERAEWVRLLSALCRRAPAHTAHYHDGRWICCNASGVEAEGCERATAGAAVGEEGAGAGGGAARLALRLDPARDLQRLHALLIAHADRLDARTHRTLPGAGAPSAAPHSQSVADSAAEAGAGEAEAAAAVGEAAAAAAEAEATTLRELREAVFDLEHRHRVHQRSLARHTRLGSKQAPIGDDNYLQLTGAGVGGGPAPEGGFFPWRTWRRDLAPTATAVVSPPATVGSESLRRAADERSSGKSNKSTGSGYLKMSCLKHDPSEESDPAPSAAPPSSDEYVHMEPRPPERRRRAADPPPPPPPPAPAPAPTLAPAPHACREYELMSDFSSYASERPPAVPPRAPPPDPPPARSLQRIKENKPLPPPPRRLSRSSHSSHPPPASPPDDSETDELPADAYCVLKVCEDEPEDAAPARSPSPAPTPASAPSPAPTPDEAATEPPRREPLPKDPEKESFGIFSRFSVQRKSNPSKSQPSGGVRALRTSSSTSSVRDAAAPPPPQPQPPSAGKPIAERLFFYRRKPKPPEECVVKPRKEENLIGKLTPRFGRSRALPRGRSLELEAGPTGAVAVVAGGAGGERRGVERSATCVGVALDSSLVAKAELLSLHRYGAPPARPALTAHTPLTALTAARPQLASSTSDIRL